MTKYWHVINIGIQNTLVYRMNFLFRSVFGLIPLFATISLWRAVYSGQRGDVWAPVFRPGPVFFAPCPPLPAASLVPASC